MAKTAPQTGFRIKLNLLHPNEIPASLPTRLLRWVVSYGRYIVIITEVIVVGAFLLRFKLDADIDTLKTSINKDLPYIEGLSEYEAQIRQTQLKLSTVGTTYTNTPDWKRIFDDLSAEVPFNLRLNNLTIDNTDDKNPFLGIKITGQTISSSELGLFIRKLRDKKDKDNNKIFKDISLDSVSFDRNVLIFNITGGVKRI